MPPDIKAIEGAVRAAFKQAPNGIMYLLEVERVVLQMGGHSEDVRPVLDRLIEYGEIVRIRPGEYWMPYT
jgi:hypothetical protein